VIAAVCVLALAAAATVLVVSRRSSPSAPAVINAAAKPLPVPSSPQVDSRPALKIATVAGTGVKAASGDGTAARLASLASPYSATIDWFGNLFYADFGSNRIRRISPCGVITTVAGDGVPGFSGDGGPAAAAELMSPSAAASDLRGNVYISDTFNHRIRKVDPRGIITTVAGTDDRGYNGDDKPATKATLWYPAGIAVDTQGDIYIADLGNNRVRKVDPRGIITTLAGEGDEGSAGDGGPATQALLDGPFGVAVDRAGDVYIADTDGQRIRKVDPRGIITTVAGTGQRGFSGDGGPATKATLNSPRGIAVDSAGNLYITDRGNERIRKVDTKGVITTLAGTGAGGFSGDNGPAGAAKLASPDGSVGIDTQGNVFIADRGNNRIRAVVPQSRKITTLTCAATR
jgi:NHL repeat